MSPSIDRCPGSDFRSGGGNESPDNGLVASSTTISDTNFPHDAMPNSCNQRCTRRRSVVRHFVVGFLLAGWPCVLRAEESVSFRSDIAPILLEHCLACHGPKNAEGGYRVDSYAELLKPGDSGETPLATSAEQSSELLRRLSCDASERMPAEAPPLTAEQIEHMAQWTKAGSPFDGEVAEQTLTLLIPPATYAAPPETYKRGVPVTACAFSPDGTQIVAGGYHELTLWNRADGQLQRRIGNVGERVFAIDFSHDGQTVAVACGQPGRNGEVRLLDFASGQLTSVVARSSDVPFDVAFRPGSDQLAIASADSTIRIIDSKTLEEVRTIAAHADWVSDVAWSDDGGRLASASRDKTAKVYDGASGELLVSYAHHAAAVRGVAFMPESLASGGSEVVSVGADNKLHRWQVADAKRGVTVDLGSDSGKVTRYAEQILIPCTDHRLLRVDLNNNSVAQQYAGHTDWVLSAAVWRDDARVLLLGSAFDGQMRIWDQASGDVLLQWLAKP